MGKEKISEKMYETTLSEVKNLEDNFKKVIGLASKYPFAIKLKQTFPL
jgi:hypothetical protein